MDEGKKFTWETFPKHKGNRTVIMYAGDLPPDWQTWAKRVDNVISQLCKADSAPYLAAKNGITNASRITGNQENVFTGVMANLMQSLELASKALDDDFFGEIEEPHAVEIPSMKLTREGVFFAGQYFDAFQKVTEIVSQAKKSIKIIDGYIDDRVLNILTSKSPSVQVEILTLKASCPPALLTAAQTFNRQYKNLSIRTSASFHDRFIIIDDTEFYHFGASIKDLGNRGFMFSLIEEPDVIDALRKKFSQEWAKSTVVV